MELKLLGVGVAQEDETVIVTESEDAARSHALSDAPETGPIVGLWLCAVSGDVAAMIAPVKETLPINRVVSLPEDL